MSGATKQVTTISSVVGGVIGGYYLYSQLKGFNAGDVTATILGMLGGAGQLPISLYYGLKSRHMRNILILAGVLSLTARRLGVLPGRSLTQKFLAFVVVAWAGYYRFFVVETPKVRCKRTHWNMQILEKANVAKMEYWPIFHSYNRHLMTILWADMSGLHMSFAPTIYFRREELKGDDGNVIMLDWFDHEGPPLSDDSPIIVVVHGIAGDSSSPYLQRFASLSHKVGWRCVSYHYWRLDWIEGRDMEIAVNHIAKSYPKAPMCGVGFSAGCHKLTRYLQIAGASSPMVCAVTVSGVLDLLACYEDVFGNENRLYKMWMDCQLVTLVERHCKYDNTIPKSVKAKMLQASKDEANCGKALYDKFHWYYLNCEKRRGGWGEEDPAFEKVCPDIVGREYKFATDPKIVDHYSNKANDHMDKIEVTTLMMHSFDDPIVTSASVDWDKVVDNKNIIVAQTKRGGHVGYIEGATPLGPTFADRMAFKFISSVLELHAQNNFMISVIRESLKVDNADVKIHSTSSATSLKAPDIKPGRMARICSISDVKSHFSSPTSP